MPAVRDSFADKDMRQDVQLAWVAFRLTLRQILSDCGARA
jgi:hypothetical protein